MFCGFESPNQSKTEDAALVTTAKPDANPPTTGKEEAYDAIEDMESRVDEMVPFEAFSSASFWTVLGPWQYAKVPGDGDRDMSVMAGGTVEPALQGSRRRGLIKRASICNVMVDVTPGAVSHATGSTVQKTSIPAFPRSAGANLE